jgi:hypothetical protein
MTTVFQPPPTYAEVFVSDPADEKLLRFNTIWLKWFVDLTKNVNATGAGSGGGDVTGPSGAVADNMVSFNGTSGKTLKDSGLAVTAAKLLPSGSTTGDVVRWNATSGLWETASEPFAFKGLTLTPAAAALVVAEGHIYYNSGSKDIQVCTSAA